MMLMRKHCSNIKFRRKAIVLVFTVSGTVVLLTELTSTTDDKLGQKHWYRLLAKISEKLSPMPISI